MKNIFHLKIILSFCLILFSCSSSDETPKPNASLENTRWVLRVLNDKKIFIPESGKEVFITFETKDNKARGDAGCNNFFTSYIKNNGILKFNPVARTEMYCEGMMDTENNFVKALEQTTRYKIKGDSLFFYDADKMIAKFEAVYLK